MFPALIAHHQEALYIQQLVYCIGWLLAGLEWNQLLYIQFLLMKSKQVLETCTGKGKSVSLQA
jgi:hypothetical protein